MTIWKLKRGADRRPRAEHPWVYASELTPAPRGLVAGSPIELQDDAGRFVARGYGNPQSQISFRALSFDPTEKNPWGREAILRRALDAWRARRQLGFRASCRLIFSEGDRLPGLIVDYYRGVVAGRETQVFAAQTLTAGMAKTLGEPENFFRQLVDAATSEGLCAIPWEQTAVVLRNDVRIRKLEGLEEESPRFIKSVREADFTNFPIQLNAATDDGFVEMECDLFLGQKTGFFLDQTSNIGEVCRLLAVNPDLPKDRPLRILDLCCYAGHWSAQITRVLKRRGFEVEATLVDVSAKALQFAKRNTERQGARTVLREGDVLKILPTLEKIYDVVICDPPAFVKQKKDLPTGRHAYMKMNSQAFRVTVKGGLTVSCSCSGLLEENDLKEILGKSIRRNGLEARCVARGGPAPDHPGRMSFPEGMYLKMFTHLVGDQTVAWGAGTTSPEGEEGEVELDVGAAGD